MSFTTLLISSGFIFFALAISYWQELKLEQDILVGAGRAFIQLLAVGYILNYVFQMNNSLFTVIILLVMTTIAAIHAAKRGKGIPGVLLIVTIAIGVGSLVTLLVLLAIKAIVFQPNQVIPVMGMVVGNSMIATGLTLTRLKESFRDKKPEIITALSLGATPRQAVKSGLQRSVKMGMIPTIDGMKTIGIVQLPGMMTGMILAGASPITAIRYQLLVVFMLSSAVAISCIIAGLLAYRTFFNEAYQFREELLD